MHHSRTTFAFSTVGRLRVAVGGCCLLLVCVSSFFVLGCALADADSIGLYTHKPIARESPSTTQTPQISVQNPAHTMSWRRGNRDPCCLLAVPAVARYF